MENYMQIDGFKIGVWTTDVCDPPCVAVNMSVAIERLEGYELTDSEKQDVTELMAGYCSYIDRYGLTGYGETEFDAIADLFSKTTKVNRHASGN